MKESVFLKRLDNGTFVEDTPQSAKILRRFKSGEVVRLDAPAKPRNYQFLKKYWKFCAVILEHSNYETKEQIDHILKIRLGLFEVYVMPWGETWKEPGSIAFANMTEDDFDTFYNNAVAVAISDFLPGWSRENFEQAMKDVEGF